MLKEFKVSSRWWEGLWGGGHTRQTDPTKRGWRAARAVKGGDVIIVGQPHMHGCFTAGLMGDGKVHVRVYQDQTPEGLVSHMESISPPPSPESWKTVDQIPGWALEFIRELETEF